ncbi:MAG: DUF1836 domain-containing protein [Oscillospiraceae bacterium]|nr:DUF1836 domain-containing protein [Oscillospiraceae bacterium]
MKGQKNTAAKENISAQLQTVRLPRWEELPDLELYMDQVLSLIRKYLLPYPGFDDNGLTASMVNNYVKAGILPAPVKKRYNRRHLSRLLIICLLKSSLSIADVRRLTLSLSSTEEPMIYDRFCELAEQSAQEVVSAMQKDNAGENVTESILRSALRSQTEQSVARTICAQLPDRAENTKNS